MNKKLTNHSTGQYSVWLVFISALVVGWICFMKAPVTMWTIADWAHGNAAYYDGWAALGSWFVQLIVVGVVEVLLYVAIGYATLRYIVRAPWKMSIEASLICALIAIAAYMHFTPMLGEVLEVIPAEVINTTITVGAFVGVVKALELLGENAHRVAVLALAIGLVLTPLLFV